MSESLHISKSVSCCCLPQLGFLYGNLNQIIFNIIIKSSFRESSNQEEYIEYFNNFIDIFYLIILFTHYLIYNKLKFNFAKCTSSCNKDSDDSGLINLINQFSMSVNQIINSMISYGGSQGVIPPGSFTNLSNIIIREIYNSYSLLILKLPHSEKYYVDVDKIMRITRTGLRFVPVKCFVALDINALSLSQLNSTLTCLQGPISYGGDPLLYYGIKFPKRQ